MRLLAPLLCACFVHCSVGARILATLPMTSPSHAVLVERLLRTLDERGHDITYITPILPHKPLGKTKVVEIHGLRDIVTKGMPQADGDENLRVSKWTSTFLLQKLGTSVSEYILSQENTQKIIKSSEKFDLILGLIYLDESILAGFSQKFNAPIVAIETFMPGHWANNLVGNPAPASFIPNPALGYSNKMNFWERMTNLLYTAILELVYTSHTLHVHDNIMRRHFGQDCPPIHDILKNTSLVLVNHHFSLGFPRPYVPNMVEIAGMHIDEPKSLPKDLEEFMDNSKRGVILFSLGSNIKGIEEKRDMFLKAFARMKQNIIWKFEGYSMNLNLPKNVKTMQWLPQADVLAHPNLKLFITHGGLLSTYEAVDRGVPMVGISLFGDHQNMHHTECAGLGKTLKYEDLSEETLYNTVTEVLNNTKYKEAAQLRSTLLKDNPMEPLNSAIWWIEYILRHKGAPHLRSASQDLTWYQLYLLDVYALAALILIPVVWINVCITKKIFRKLGGLFCKSCQKTSINKKNN